MGYRSEVMLTLSRNGLAQLYKDIPTQLNNMVECSDAFLQKQDAFLLHWDYIKWHEEYGDISALMKSLSKMDSAEYYFLRLGENHDDVEEKGGYWDNPFETSISRSIHCDTDGCKEVDLSVFQ